MSYGLQVFDSSSVLTFDSNDAIAGVPLGLFAVAAGAGSTTYTYPSLAGRTIKAVGYEVGGSPNVTIDYALGYPRAIVAGSDIAQTVLLVAI